MLVLEADRLLRILGDPLREEDHAVQLALTQVEGNRDGGAGRLVPGDLEDAVAQPHDVGDLIAHPAAADYARMDAIVDHAIVLDVQLVLPTLVISIYEIITYKPGQFFGFRGFKFVRH
ncbi:hypothetical protein [Breoghania sp.]|uniref:hypothetical protein n=1 Tax=Breoghania sp. TaxID=2065378 RepID=UPI00262ED519|nr:hypothetical protein [Breoghania sp.]MDJ0932237.1 hypothetical protein [Breoghania sp.]